MAQRSNLSRRKQQSQASAVNDSSDEEPSSSTQRSNQRNNDYSKLSGDIQEQLVNNCVHYLLIANQKGYSIKKIDIVKHVLKEYPRMFPMIIAQAVAILNRVFAIEVVEVENKKGHYLLINALDFNFKELNPKQLQFWSNPEHSHYGLLFIILVLIFKNGNVIPEVQLWQFLKKLGLDVESDRPHPLFGNVKKLVSQEFVRKLYLEHKLLPGSEPPVYEFRFGPRVPLETSTDDMERFVNQLYQDSRPEQ